MLLALPFRDRIDIANIDVLFLLAVFMVAIRWGRGPAILAALLGVAMFDFFFVPPYFSFAVADAQYLISFAVMLSVGVVTSHLVARLAEQSEVARARELETRTLYDLARQLGTASSLGQMDGHLARFLSDLALDASLLLIATPGTPPEQIEFSVLGGRPLSTMELGFARASCAKPSTLETDALAGTGVAILFVPLVASTGVLGVLAIAPRDADVDALRDRRPLLEAVASLSATMVERLRFAESASRSELDAAAERLRTTILSSLSHDLRTPLTSIVGLADNIARQPAPPGDEIAASARALRDQAHAMHHVLSNLLEMARLQSGRVKLNLEWQPMEEVIGSSTRLLADQLARRRLDIDLPRDLPLVRFDAVLIERVLCNLLENALKFSTPGTPLLLSVVLAQETLEVGVENLGPGIPPERMATIFDAFVRGRDEAAIPGSGLGLAICKAIMLAHGGSIRAENFAHGVRVVFALPRGTPPTIVEEPAA